jgi:hypothetical protein
LAAHFAEYRLFEGGQVADALGQVLRKEWDPRVEAPVWPALPREWSPGGGVLG